MLWSNVAVFLLLSCSYLCLLGCLSCDHIQMKSSEGLRCSSNVPQRWRRLQITRSSLIYCCSGCSRHVHVTNGAHTSASVQPKGWGVVVWFFASVFHGDKTVCTSYYPLSHKLFITIHVSSMMIVMAMTTIWCSRTQETHKTKHNIGIGNMRQCLTKIYNGQRRPSCNEITTLCLAFDKLF